MAVVWFEANVSVGKFGDTPVSPGSLIRSIERAHATPSAWFGDWLTLVKAKRVALQEYELERLLRTGKLITPLSAEAATMLAQLAINEGRFGDRDNR